MKNKIQKTAQCLLFFLLGTTLLLAQNKPHAQRCGTSEGIKALYKLHPQSREESSKLNQKSKEFAQKQKAKRQSSSIVLSNHNQYTIPVVVHVFGDDFAGYQVNDDIIREAINQVNNDFNGMNSDFNDVIPQFSNLRGTLDISFEFAQIDPDGNATSGIIYYPAAYGFGEGSSHNDEIQAVAWDNYKYLNLYIMLELYNDGATNASGVAWYPDTWMSDNNLARIVYNGRYLWGNGGDSEFQATLTHEFGHWLNLIHTFGEDDSCFDDDEVEDTPMTVANLDCNTSQETCSGAGIPNSSNYMDYSDCRRMFTLGQIDRMLVALQHDARWSLWQDENLSATGTGHNDIGAHLLLSATKLIEDDENDGSFFDMEITVSAEDGAEFSVWNGYLTEGTHYTTSGIPSGLSVSIQANGSNLATIRMEGNANTHGDNSDTEITISFRDAALVGGVSSVFAEDMILNLDFLDPYQLVFEDFNDLSVDENSVWEPFDINITGNGSYGIWVFPENGDLKFESYGKPLICEGNSRNISFLQAGDVINESRNWVENGEWDEIANISSATHTDWNGQTGYLGIQATNQYGRAVFGWLKASVSASGDEYTIYEYAYNEDPNGAIYAGETGLGARLSYSSNIFYEDIPNNGAIETAISISALDGAQFDVNGDMMEGTHFIASNVPSGLSVEIFVENSNLATLSLVGNANSHTDAADINNMEIEFRNAAFSGNASSIVNSTYTFSIDFNDVYQIIYEDIEDITVNSSNDWGWFYLNNGYFDEFGLFIDGGELKLETYTKPLICEGNSLRVSLLDEGDAIGSSSNWVDGGSYPDLHEMWTPTYTVWEGQTGFVGFEYYTNTGRIMYGWFRISMSSNGDSMTLHDYAYNQEPNATIYAGETAGGGGNPPGDYCASLASNATSEYISRVEFGEFQNTSQGSGYSNFTNQTITLVRNSSNSFSLTPDFAGSIYTEYFKIWIDYNEDGDFEDGNELVFEGQTTDGSSVVGSITPPSSVDLETTRMRISMRGDNPPVGPCDTFSYGEVEDYTVTINNGGGSVPQADFIANSTNINVGNSVSFTDLSSGSPTSWNWEFEGGTPATSTNQNPTVTYNTAGTFNVTLTVSNNNGTGEQTYNNYISVSNGGGGDYCESSSNNSVTEYISAVQIGDFSHSSGGDRYSHYTAQTIPLEMGQNTNLSIDTYVNGNYTEYIKVWIDYDQDETFESSELIFENSIQGQQSIATNFTPPTNALEGETRMRISMAGDNEQSGACDTFSYGEVEDYTVSLGVDGGGTPSEYCASAGNNSANEWIATVEVGSFSYTSGAADYSDHTNQIINLNAGSNTVISISPGMNGGPWDEYIRVWIDYNQDGDFNDGNEVVFEGISENVATVNGNFSVLSSAQNGNTRMRISMKGDGGAYADPCETFNYGEVEDYMVNISGGVAGVVGQSNISGNRYEENLNPPHITLAPNPVTNGVLTVSLHLEKGNISQFRVLNNVGNLMYEQSVYLQGNEKTRLILGNLPAGLYFLQTMGESGINTHKFLIQ
ncbi:GEVED domain-containing protein [Xanthovirga aplysinae]|uniref:GEVED domain-containing protein n=1 Tax=Xanthovirga aplysinae TaxID=2529853 RepID=UPI0012BBCBA6|nr:GEVED domain-containing protein [Xanthovirga aplysinae]MTI33403.1 PKD domain-containing protein [Xanthovirga aplysinae]